MEGLRTEVHFHTREQVTQHVQDALGVLEDAGVPEHLEVALLPHVLSLLANKNVQIQAVQGGGLDLAHLAAHRPNNDLRG